MKEKILKELKNNPMCWKEIHAKFGQEAFEPMKELIDQDKIKSNNEIWSVK